MKMIAVLSVAALLGSGNIFAEQWRYSPSQMGLICADKDNETESCRIWREDVAESAKKSQAVRAQAPTAAPVPKERKGFQGLEAADHALFIAEHNVDKPNLIAQKKGLARANQPRPQPMLKLIGEAGPEISSKLTPYINLDSCVLKCGVRLLATTDEKYEKQHQACVDACALVNKKVETARGQANIPPPTPMLKLIGDSSNARVVSLKIFSEKFPNGKNDAIFADGNRGNLCTDFGEEDFSFSVSSGLSHNQIAVTYKNGKCYMNGFGPYSSISFPEKNKGPGDYLLAKNLETKEINFFTKDGNPLDPSFAPKLPHAKSVKSINLCSLPDDYITVGSCKFQLQRPWLSALVMVAPEVVTKNLQPRCALDIEAGRLTPDRSQGGEIDKMGACTALRYRPYSAPKFGGAFSCQTRDGKITEYFIPPKCFAGFGLYAEAFNKEDKKVEDSPRTFDGKKFSDENLTKKPRVEVKMK